MASAGVLALGSMAPGGLAASLEKAAATAPPAPGDWAAVKALFDLAPDRLHFASFYLASHPRPVREAIEGHRRSLDADPFETVEQAMFEDRSENLEHRAGQDVASYLGGTAEEIAFTGNTTSGLALVYHGLPLGPGDEILTTTHDHYVHHESIRFACERSGASWRRVAAFDPPERATVGGIVERLHSAIGERTRALGVTWVQSSSGVRMPIRDIARMLADVNRSRDPDERVALVVDGVHGLGAVDEPVASLGCDYFCAGAHKWMFAPRGTGIVWARPDRWAKLRPLIPTFSSADMFEAWSEERLPAGPTTAARMTPGGFHAYEHEWAIGAAFRFHERLGRDAIAARIRTLNDRLKAGLRDVPGVTLHTPLDSALSAGIVCFEVAGKSETEVVGRLLERKIVASTTPYRISYARLAPSLVNDEREVDAAVAAVRDLAGN